MHTHNQKVGGPRSTSEATLFHQAQAGCQDSLSALMTRHDGLVQAVVRRQVLGQMPFFEALQAGRTTPREVWLFPPMPGPALCVMFGEPSRPMLVSIRSL